MELQTLRYFVSVYKELSFSRAAKCCFVAQPSVSAAIQQLESELDCQLFIRHSKGVSPTQDAKIFYPHAIKVVSDIQVMQQLFQKKDLLLPFKIGLMPFLSGERISQIIKDLLDNLQGLDLTIVDWNADADARIVSSTMVRQNENFKKLWCDQYVLAMPEGHPLSRQKSIQLKQLDGVPFISRTFCDALDSWNHAIQKQRIQINTKATFNTEEYALDLVAAGLGISLVPSHSTTLHTNIITRVISDVQLERIVGLAYKVDHPLPSQLLTTINKFKDRIESVI